MWETICKSINNFLSYFNLNIISLLIDILIIIIIVYNILKSSKQGFISQILSLILTFITYIIIWPLSNILSNKIYKLFFKDIISKVIYNKLINTDLINNFFITNDKYFKEYLKLNKIIDQTTLYKISYDISDNFVLPLMETIMCIIILIMITILSLLIIKLLNKFFRYFSYIPIIGKFNIFLGGFIGLCKGLIIIGIISIVINNLIYISGNRWTFLNYKIKDQTYLLKKYDEYICEKNKLIFIKKKIKNRIFNKY